MEIQFEDLISKFKAIVVNLLYNIFVMLITSNSYPIGFSDYGIFSKEQFFFDFTCTFLFLEVINLINETTFLNSNIRARVQLTEYEYF